MSDRDELREAGKQAVVDLFDRHRYSDPSEADIVNAILDALLAHPDALLAEMGYEVGNRRIIIGPMVDALMGYWLQATHEHMELREWWESSDCADTALEMAHAVRDELIARGVVFARVPVPEPSEGER